MRIQDQEKTKMGRLTLTAAVVAGIALLVAVPAVGMAVIDGTSQTEQVGNETAPGERLAGVVGVQEAEIEAGIEYRSFDIRLSQAESQAQQADAVSDRIDNVQERVEELEARKTQLDEMRASGEISEGRYKAQVAKIAAEIEILQDLGNQSERAAGELPADLLQERGINVTAIQTLSERAEKLGGQEVAEIARDIAGGPPDEVGPPIERAGPPDDPGPPGNTSETPENESENSDQGVDPPGGDQPGEGDGQPNGTDNPGNGERPPADGSEDSEESDDQSEDGDSDDSEQPGDGPPEQDDGQESDDSDDSDDGDDSDDSEESDDGDGPPGEGGGPPGDDDGPNQ
jgi:TolA-binding protein